MQALVDAGKTLYLVTNGSHVSPPAVLKLRLSWTSRLLGQARRQGSRYSRQL